MISNTIAEGYLVKRATSSSARWGAAVGYENTGKPITGVTHPAAHKESHGRSASAEVLENLILRNMAKIK
ncbi:hypothetical protein ACMFMF_002076 [Clarireedia jacksonii]